MLLPDNRGGMKYAEKGFIYVKDGIISDVGEGESPSEYKYPDILINGENRMIIPGMIDGYSISYLSPLSSLIALSKIKKISENKDLLSVLSDTDVYYLTVIGVISRVMRGVTTVVTEIPKIDLAVKIADLLGVRMIAVVNIDRYSKEETADHVLRMRKYERYKEDLLRVAFYTSRLELLEVVREFMPNNTVLIHWSLCDKIQDDSKVIVVDPPPDLCRNLMSISTDPNVSIDEVISGRKFIGTGANRSRIVTDNMIYQIDRTRLSLVDLFNRLTRDVAGVYGLPTGFIEKGLYSDLVMYDLSQPPASPFYHDKNILLRMILWDMPRIESVIIGKEIIIDGGEILSVGSDLYRRAYRRLRDVIKDLASEELSS
ncbi:MAG: hypothetical protein QXJ51_05900 [Sulfolobales archaeon]